MRQMSLLDGKTTLVLAMAAALLWPLLCGHTSVKQWTLFEMTRSAELVVLGRVSANTETAMVLRVEKVLKGTHARSDLEITMDRTRSFHGLPASAYHEVGDRVVVFAIHEESRLVPYAGYQGSLTLRNDEPAQYTRAIELLSKFDRAQRPEERTEILHTMLGLPAPSQHEALLIVATKQREIAFDLEPLVPTIMKVARQAAPNVSVLAINVLAHRGGRDVIAVLLELMDRREFVPARAAYLAFHHMTRAPVTHDGQLTVENRAAQVQAARQWWAQNRHQARLTP